MIIEMRDYVLHPGTLPRFYALYEAQGLPVQQRILGDLIGFFHSDIGTLNRIIHLWRYTSLDDRSERRAMLAADPDWQAYLAEATPMFRTMTSTILLPAPFSPLQ